MILRRAFWLALLFACTALGTSASAAPVFCPPGGDPSSICYDDVLFPVFEFTGINEKIQSPDDIPVLPTNGLYQQPVGLPVNILAFTPSSFDAVSNFGSGFDQTHSTLNLTISSNNPLSPIEFLSITEDGDYTFFGVGTAATGVQQTIGGQLLITNTVIGAGDPLIGQTIAIDAVIDVVGTTSETFTVSSNGVITPVGGGFFATIADGAGTFNWTIEYTLDISGLGITEMELQLNNVQFANSEATASASIQKKVSIEVVPEPGTFALMGLGLVGCAVARRCVRKS